MELNSSRSEPSKGVGANGQAPKQLCRSEGYDSASLICMSRAPRYRRERARAQRRANGVASGGGRRTRAGRRKKHATAHPTDSATSVALPALVPDPFSQFSRPKRALPHTWPPAVAAAADCMATRGPFLPSATLSLTPSGAPTLGLPPAGYPPR